MTLSNVQSSWSLGLLISRAAQVTAGSLMLASAARHFAEADIPLGLEAWTSQNWTQAQIGILAAGGALWFLLPSLFQNRLVSCRKGRPRLMIVLIFSGLLIYLMSFGLWLLGASSSPLRDRVPAPSLIYGFSGFAVIYLYAFILPGRAFSHARRSAPVPPTIPNEIPVRSDRNRSHGSVLRLLSLFLLLTYWALGWFGQSRAAWLPDPAIADWVTAHWLVLAGGVAALAFALFIGSGLGRTAAWRRTNRGRITLGLAASAVSVVFLSPALTRGLPWTASFLNSEGPGAMDVVVIERINNSRRTTCERAT
ncbi:MAG: hypothetical protein WBB85_00355, partial [Albidovulum sp.]|uniref:hypothetical protein n=1 Tax=Albidovulum sp. TaxID=1872424 RepID=UPI003CBCC01E